jgi:acetyl-CoA carboxylase biotin carboxylase subunit
MFKKLLVANRGEIALRVFRTCREMGIGTVAVHSEVDRNSPHARYADRSVWLGDDEPAESYLHIDKIVKAARDSGAEAVHPGYGFLAENADFAEACERAGVVFVGPTSKVLRSVGDKIEARRLAREAKVPITPGTRDPTDDLQLLQTAAEHLGFPVMVKAAAGGGGKGMRRVDNPEELDSALQAAASEARAAFSDGTLYLEKCIEDPRHVEVQILADGRGNVVHLFERECSIQRRHQKIIEEAPSPAVGTELRAQLGDAAVEVARQAGYQNAGTVEFLLDSDGHFNFMEVNARLQVEHPVTELITGLDLVEHQIRLAAGEPLSISQENVTARGHAIECRIYAEDPEAGFLPSPGVIRSLVAPSGPDVRFDSGVETGSEVPVHYDPILAKLITRGADRHRAIARMIRALSETSILGVKTPVEMLMDIVQSEAFRKGETTTGFLGRYFADWNPSPHRVKTALLGWLAFQLDQPAATAEGGLPDATNAGAGSEDIWLRLGRWRMGDA